MFSGETFFVDVAVADIRADPGETPAGVIALPLNISYDPSRFTFIGNTNLTSAGNDVLPIDDPIVTDDFVLQRSVGGFDPDAAAFDASADPATLSDFFNLTDVRGGALPAASLGSAIGQTTAETFSRLAFVAVNPSDTPATVTVNLAGSLSFADAAVLDDVIAIGDTVDVFALASTVQNSILIDGGQIGGVKFDDTDGDGIRDPGEPGSPGVAFNLLDTADNVIDTVQTDASGQFAFAGLSAGSFTVVEIVPSGVTPTTATTAGATISSTMPSVGDLSFGNFTNVSIGGIKFNDLDGDGVRDAGEPGIGGVTMNLTIGGTVRQIVTAADGSFAFENVGPGQATIAEVVPDGFVPTSPAGGTMIIATQSGVDVTDLVFGNTEIVTESSIAGTVFTDNDFDGVIDANEFGLSGVTIELFTGGTSIATTTTDANGDYRFDDLSAGTYAVQEIQPARFADASITLGTIQPAGESSGTTTGLNRFDDIILDGGQSAVDYNFGDVAAAVSKRFFLASTDAFDEVNRLMGPMPSTANTAATVSSTSTIEPSPVQLPVTSTKQRRDDAADRTATCLTDELETHVSNDDPADTVRNGFSATASHDVALAAITHWRRRAFAGS